MAGFEPNLLVEFESVADRQLVAGVEIHDLGWKNQLACSPLTDLGVKPY